MNKYLELENCEIFSAPSFFSPRLRGRESPILPLYHPLLPVQSRFTGRGQRPLTGPQDVFLIADLKGFLSFQHEIHFIFIGINVLVLPQKLGHRFCEILPEWSAAIIRATGSRRHVGPL